jgi:hypothetical protein
VSSETDLQYLGFQPGRAVTVPDRLVAQLPLGATLESGAARQAAQSSGPGN